MKKTIFLTLIFTVLLALTACKSTPTPTPAPQVEIPPLDAIIAEGHIIPEDDLYLSFPVYGKVSEILVENGDAVKAGDVLIRLGDREQAEAALIAARTELIAAQQAYDDFIRLADFSHAQAWSAYLQAQAARAEAQAAWDALDVDEIEDRIDDAQAEVNDQRDILDDAQDEFDKYADLDDDNASRKKAKEELDAAIEDYNAVIRTLEATRRERDLPRAALDEALAAEAEARRDFENTLSGPDAEQLALLEGRLESAQAQVAAAEAALENYELTAPFNGTVVEINVSEGQMVGPETWAVLIADFSRWYVETSDLTELEVVDVFVGQMATIVPDALPDVEIKGVIEEIGQGFYVQGGDISYKVRLRIDETNPQLRWGMTVEITFASEK